VRAAIVLLAVAAGVARADRITAPAGWQAKPEQAAEHEAKQRRLSHFGGAPNDATVAVYAPAEPGIVLYVTTIVALADAAPGVRAEVTDHKLPATAAGVEVKDSSERVDVVRREVESKLAVHDKAAQLVTVSRMVIAGDAKKVVGVTGDCIARDDIDRKVLDACSGALATLDPQIALADRVALSLAAPPAGSAASTGSPSLSPRLDDGSRVQMPPIVVPQDSQTDRRPIYIGAGLVVLALVFWWNRQRREKFERDDAVARGDAPAEPERSGDADAEDLHAAAEGATETKTEPNKGDADER